VAAAATQGGIMNLAAGRTRTSEVSRTELEHCILRVVIAGLVTLWLAFVVSRRASGWTETDKVAWSYLAAWLALAVGLLATTWIWPAPNTWRRALGVILDVGLVSVALHFMGSPGAAIVWRLPLYRI